MKCSSYKQDVCGWAERGIGQKKETIGKSLTIVFDKNCYQKVIVCEQEFPSSILYLSALICNVWYLNSGPERPLGCWTIYNWNVSVTGTDFRSWFYFGQWPYAFKFFFYILLVSCHYIKQGKRMRLLCACWTEVSAVHAEIDWSGLNNLTCAAHGAAVTSSRCKEYKIFTPQ